MSCPEYPKIDTLFERDDKFKVDPLRVRRSEFLIPHEWIVTEKIDGTNVRVSLEQSSDLAGALNLNSSWAVRFYGRTAAAQMPTFLLEYLQRTFTLEKIQNLWRGKSSCDKCGGQGQFDSGEPKLLTRSYPGHRDYQCDCVKPYPIVLYGEGYGAKIQKGGGNYRRDDDVSFRLFDVMINGLWLSLSNVQDVARHLNIATVPRIKSAADLLTANEVVGYVRSGYQSVVAEIEGASGTLAEGIVAFTDPPLFNGCGRRLMWKLKTRDF